MPKNKSGISRLVKELQRRGVLKVITMYAASAFIVLQLVDILAPALALPHWIVTVVIILLAVGFPVVAILSWIFDITPEGIKKTEDLDEESFEDEFAVKQRRRFKVSDGVIIALVIIIGILIYPKIFSRDELKSLRDSDGKISIAVLPFSNISGDSVYNIWSGGFQNLLINTLSDSPELSVRQYQSVNNLVNNKMEMNTASFTPSFGKNIANDLESKTFILGNILKAGMKIRINASLMDTDTEEIYKTFQIDGLSENDLFGIADSLSHLIRNYIEIQKILDEENKLESRSIATTHSSDAFKYYIHGFNALMEIELSSAADWFLRSIEEDSMFISPYVMLAYTYASMGNNRMSKSVCDQVSIKSENASLEQQLIIKQLNAYFYETPNEEIKCFKQLLEIDDLNPMYWHLMGSSHYRILEYEEALKCWEKAVEIPQKWGTHFHNPYIYFLMGHVYHEIGEHKKEDEIYELGLEYFPENFMILQFQAICALKKGEVEKANRIIDVYKQLRHESLTCTEAMISSGLGYIYQEGGDYVKAEEFYRESIVKEPDNISWENTLAWFLIDKEINVEEGIEIAAKLLEQYPNNPYFLDTNGWGLYKLGDVENAYEYIKKSWDTKFMYNHEIYLHLQEVTKAYNKIAVAQM